VDGEVEAREPVTPPRDDLLDFRRPGGQLMPAMVSDAVLADELVAELEVAAVPDLLEKAGHDLLVGREIRGRGASGALCQAADRDDEEDRRAGEKTDQTPGANRSHLRKEEVDRF